MPKRRSTQLNVPATKAKKVNKEQNTVAVVADATVDDPSPPIFNLIDDCCYAILDCLSLLDLHSFRQTCKWAQRNAANFYKMNHSAVDYSVPMNNDSDVGFELENVQKIIISGRRLEKFRVVQEHCNPLIKQIHLKCTNLSVAKIKCLEKVLPSVERVIVDDCKLNGDLYKSLLKFCTNLKVLCVVSDSGGCNHNPNISQNMIGKNNNWLTQKYPKLERLKLIQRNGPPKINELKIFFEENPNVRSFTIDSTFFLENYDLFKTTNIKLEMLAIRFNGKDFTTFCDNLNSLHERGIFKRLHLHTEVMRVSEGMISLNALEKFVVGFWCAKECEIILPHLTNLKELRNHYIFDNSCMNDTARNLVNLERVYVHARTYEAIRPFIFYSAKLKKIKYEYSFERASDEVINLRKWNKEREKLAEARKLTIYVPESVYSATKWAMDKTDYDLIELKRETSYDWDDDFT